MKRTAIVIGALTLSALAAGAQTTTPTAPSSPGAAPSTSVPSAPSTTSPLPAPRQGVDSQAPLPGANSFTENQVRERLESNGYTAITGLRKDEQGVWRGTAMRQGANTPFALDYRGNISQQ